MNLKEQNEICVNFFKDCADNLERKGADYTVDGDVFKDVMDEARSMGVNPTAIIWLAMNKHYKAVRRYCTEGKVESEPIRGRLLDLVNYAVILISLIEHLQEKDGSEKS